jgi:hypothetical protein
MTRLHKISAAALLGAVLLFASGAAAQVPGGSVGVKPPFINGDCVKASGPSSISTTGSACGGSGTVTSVDVSGGTTGLTFSGGPITTSGTITMGGGPLGVDFGGTGAATLTSNGLVYGSGTSAVGVTAAGTNGTVLIGNTGAAPSFSALTGLAVTSLSMGSTGLTPNSATQGAITVAGTLDVDNGGTGQTSYTNGQLLIGNTTGNTLTNATLTAGNNITITNGAGSITIAASGGGGSGCTTSGTAGYVLTDDGAGGCTSNPGFRYATGTATLGTAGGQAGALAFQNATSGTLTLAPPAGALGTVTVTVPAATDTLVNLASSQTLTNKTIAYASNTLTGVAPTASPTFTGTVTMPQGTWTSSGIAGAAFNNGIIGGTTPLAGTFTTLTANTSLTLNGSTAMTSASGNGAVLVTSTGAQTSGRCVQIDANGNHAAASAACGVGTVNSGTANQMAYYSASAAAVSGNANATISGGALTLGVSTSALGSLVLSGNTSGAVTIQPQAAAGTYNFNLPTGAGSSGQPLLSGGGAGSAMTFGTLGVGAGGTGQTTYTNGQLLIGNTSGNTLTKATITAGSGITVTNGNGSITIAASGTSSNTPVSKTSNFNATAGSANNPTIYSVDTTSGAVTATLPASPANGDTILFLDAKQRFATANLILGRNSLTIMGSATDLTVSNNNANFHATYVSDGVVTTWILW